MKILFTICSNNYLAQAKVLLQSSKEKTSDYLFYLFVVDVQNMNIDYDSFGFSKIVFIRDLLPESIDLLISKYNLIELNTSIKATAFKYIISQNVGSEIVIYLDPDIQIFSSLNLLEKILQSKSIVLSPHITSPIEIDNFSPNENIFLNYGLYNLGFIALSSQNIEAKIFLNWWEERLLTQCFINLKEGLFVDQLWINLVPLMFQDVFIIKDLGYNMAPWNLHERHLGYQNDKLMVNERHQLVFYHFSSIDFENKANISKPYYSRFNFLNRPDLFRIYSTYFELLEKNENKYYSKFKCELYPPVETENEITTSNKFEFHDIFFRIISRINKLF
jgi:hypothetical protein